MATRRTEKYHFDHGAQFFTAQTTEFKEFCKPAEKDDIITSWQPRYSEINNNKISKNYIAKNYYVAKPQMNNLCKYLGQKLNIILKQQIVKISFDNNKWHLETSEGKISDNLQNFDYLILAIPAPQAANLLPNNCKYFDMVNNIKMLGCFTLMLGFHKPLDLGFDAAKVKNSIIQWIAVNNSKAQRLENFSLVVNSSNQWAEKNIEIDTEIATKKMLTALNNIISINENNIAYKNMQRWRYANSPVRAGQKSLFDKELNLGICGDWLISGKVENAFLSALDLYKNIS